MKKTFPLLVAILVVAGIIFAKKTFLSPKPIEVPKYGSYLSCVGHPFDTKVKFKSSVVLLKSALPEGEDRNYLFYSAGYYQNLYAFMNLSDYNQNTQLKWSALTDKNPQIKVLKTEDVPYPVDVDFPSEIDMLNFTPDAEMYLTNLTKIGKIRKGDPAIRVEYEYENDILLCFNENKIDFTNIKVAQPIDPYTAYFYVPEKDRRFFSNTERNAEKVINPCMNPEAVTPNNITPLYLWFYWRPFAEGHDSKNVAFNCNDYYRKGETINIVDVKTSENPPKQTAHLAFDKLASLDRPLSIALFMGTAESKAFVKFQKDEVEEYIKKYLSGIDSITAKNELPYHKRKYDLKFSTLLWFIRNLSEQMEIKAADYAVNEYEVKVTLKGKFKLSRKDAIISLYLNQPNPKYEGSDLFKEKFAKEFLANDVVIYGGHANAVYSFSQAFKTYNSEMLSNAKPLNYQIFAILSCSANFMFNPGTFPKTQVEGFERDFIHTAGGFSDTSGNSALILIGQIDSYLYNKKYVPFAFWAKMAKSDNFYILSNH